MASIDGRRTRLEAKRAEDGALGKGRQPYCVVIGGGQGGIMLGARLKQLDVPTIILEKNSHPGDSWRNRYRSLVLHDPVWYDHLPYIPFPENWPIFTPKDKLGDWLEMYTKVMELNYWSSSEAVHAAYDADKREWTVEVSRDGAPRHIEAKAARVRHWRIRAAQRHFVAGPREFPGTSISTQADTRPALLMRTKTASSSAPTAPPTTSLRTYGSTARASLCCSGRRQPSFGRRR